MIDISYIGNPLDEYDQNMIISVCEQSAHPLSKAISKYLSKTKTLEIEAYTEIIGSGLSASILGKDIRIGSSRFIFDTIDDNHRQGVFIEIDGKYLGRFEFKHAFRENVESIIQSLDRKYKLAILSGDTDHESERIQSLVGDHCEVYFNQSPKNKLDKIKSLQEEGYKVMMIGDGLNDAGALNQANVGMVISDDENNFSPACDGIVEASKFSKLYDQLTYLKAAKRIIYGAFAMAFMYNSIGLYFAMSGQLSPVISAIIMPLSSITVIIYGVVVSWICYQKNQK
jgi:Cu+-exporting ATPase